MQEPSPSKRRVGCVMWLAIFAIIMSLVSLLSSVTQELAWDRRIQEIATLVSTANTNAQDSPPLIITQAQQEQPSVVIVGPDASPTSVSIPPTAIPAPTVVPVGLTYEEICGVDERNMTDPQLASHAARFNGQSFSGWRGWVYDVVNKSDDTYDLEIAMEERGPFWTRDIVVEEIPVDLATRLNVEQPLVFDGRIAQVEYSFEVMCNPMTVDNLVLR